MSDRILKFEPDLMLTRIFGVFILFGTVTSGGGILRVVSKGYVILHNIGSGFELMLLFWLSFLQQLIDLKNLKL